MAKVTYERETCGRCGGSGRHSFNYRDRDVCYGCGGSGETLTKRGAAARAFATELLEIRIEDFARLEGRRAKYTSNLGGEATFSGAVRTELPILRKGDGSPVYGWRLIFRKTDGSTKLSSFELSDGTRVRLIPNDDEIAKIEAYQSSLTKAGKPRKVKA